MFYDNFKALCKKKGKTIKQVAEDLGVDRSTIFSWQRYYPRADKLTKIADYFGVTTDYLVGVEKKNTAPETEDGTLAEATALFARLPEDQRYAVLTLLREIVNK